VGCRIQERKVGEQLSVAIGKLLSEVKQKIELEELSGKVIAVDAYNTIYQFLSIIRQPDGRPLTDSKGRITSHLSGLFYRTINMVEKNVIPVFVFDGTPPALKMRTLEARGKRREEARENWEEAIRKGMIEEARTYAMASTRINKEIVEDSKKLLEYMGIACIQAPSEGEAQAAEMVKSGAVYASASQDYDSFLFGADVVIRNLTLTGRRKLPGKNIFVNVEIERIFLEDVLRNAGISRSQLIWLGMLVGTDFNEGIKGVGPMTALKIIKEKKSVEEVFAFAKEKYNIELSFDPKEVEEVFTKLDVLDIKKEDVEKMLKETSPSKEKISKFLCDEHEFSHERVEKFAEKLLAAKKSSGQKGMASWI
jgi:flap endonuclease-1